MAYIDFMSAVHKSTKRDYLARVNSISKAEAAKKAKLFDYDYWDGDRRICYGGYTYIPGRWRPVADALVRHYGLTNQSRVLDVGCGKGFLLYELTQALPGLQVRGLDISKYALEHAKEEVRPMLDLGHAASLPYPDKAFDLVISLNTLHCLECFDLDKALRELTRVARNAYLCVESYRNEEEKANLLYWQVTCEAFLSPKAWDWWFTHTGYKGDHSFIYFE